MSPAPAEAHRGRPCPLCQAPGGLTAYRIASLPVHSCLVMDTREEALAITRGRLELVFCERCGYLANRAFDESSTSYTTRYEDSQAFSPTFVAYAEQLAQQWVEGWSLEGRSVVEIGAGRGDFSRILVQNGARRVLAMDPTIDLLRFVADEPRIEAVVQAFRAPADLPAADAVVMRHVLEHIDDPVALLGSLREALADRPDTPVLVEVPDAARILAEGAFWDVYYEHCAYLTEETLRELFESCGFEVHRLSRAYDGQYLLIEATASGERRPAGLAPAVVAAQRERVVRFSETAAATVRTWASVLADAVSSRESAVVWGSGSKGTAFLIALGSTASVVGRVVDINPHLEGKFIAGTGHPIVAPADLARYGSGLVIAMNPVYAAEIQAMVDDLSPGGRVLALGLESGVGAGRPSA